MIKSVTVTNYRNESLTLELSNPFDIGINVRSIEGIGPPKGNVNYTEITSGDGGVYNSSRASARNITMELGPMVTPSVEENRHKIYKYFVLNKQVTLTFTTDQRICQIVGYVEKVEPDIFSEDETIDVSIVCPDPYFYSVDAEIGSVNFSGVVDTFEFPFENPIESGKSVLSVFPMSLAASARSAQTIKLSDILITGIVDPDGYFITSYGSYSVATIDITDAQTVTVERTGSMYYTVNVYIFRGVKPAQDYLEYVNDVVEGWDGSSKTVYPSSYESYGMNLYLVFEVEASLENAKANADVTINIYDGTGGDGTIPDFPDPPDPYPLYPMEIETTDTSNQNLEFATLVYRQEENIPYDGDVATGITIHLHALGEVRNITIYNMDTRERLVIDTNRINEITGYTFNSGDDIIINTLKGNKSITYIHEGVSYNILNALERNTDWFEIAKGDNVFSYICEYGTENLQFIIEYPTLYWGI